MSKTGKNECMHRRGAASYNRPTGRKHQPSPKDEASRRGSGVGHDQKRYAESQQRALSQEVPGTVGLTAYRATA